MSKIKFFFSSLVFMAYCLLTNNVKADVGPVGSHSFRDYPQSPKSFMDLFSPNEIIIGIVILIVIIISFIILFKIRKK